jgi:hypothetical protein
VNLALEAPYLQIIVLPSLSVMTPTTAVPSFSATRILAQIPAVAGACEV